MKLWGMSNGGNKLSILLILAIFVGAASFLTLQSRLFSGGTSIAPVIAYITAAVYGVSSIGSKVYSPKTTWLYNTNGVRSRVWLGNSVRYGSIVVFAIVVFVLTNYMFSFEPNGVKYSELTFYVVVILFIFSPVIIVIMSWTSATKL